MHTAALTFIHLIVILAKMLRAIGWNKIAPENLALKHQLAIMARSQEEAREKRPGPKGPSQELIRAIAENRKAQSSFLDISNFARKSHGRGFLRLP